MRLIIDKIGGDVLTSAVKSGAWLALKTRNFYSISVIWSVIGPKTLFTAGSEYAWIYYAFLTGPVLIILVWLVHLWKPQWQLETRRNLLLRMYGASIFPVHQTANLFTSSVVALFFMGYMLKCHGAWFESRATANGVMHRRAATSIDASRPTPCHRMRSTKSLSALSIMAVATF